MDLIYILKNGHLKRRQTYFTFVFIGICSSYCSFDLFSLIKSKGDINHTELSKIGSKQCLLDPTK